MDLSTILGIVVGFGMLLGGYAIEGGSLSALVMLSPIIIVFGGTLGAIMISFSLKDVLSIPKILVNACTSKKSQTAQMVEQLVNMSEVARQNGLLGIEKIINSDAVKDPLLIKGGTLIIDGTDSNLMRDTLDNEIYLAEQKRKIEISIFEAAGGFSPTMGIIGTVMGLVQVLGNMGDPKELAAKIAVAFIATLYGVCFANLIYLPIANKLKLNLKRFRIEKEMIIEGLLAIRNGETPKAVREKLDSYLEFESAKSSKGKGK